MQSLVKGYGTYHSHHLLSLRGPATSLSLLPSPLCPSASSLQKKKKKDKKKKKKEKEKNGKSRKSGLSSHGYEFGQLMIAWDEVFLRCCKDPAVAAAVRDVSRRGLDSHGRGCVLVCESIRTKPHGASSGFTHKLRKNAREPPSYDTLRRSISYVPRDFLLDLANAPEEDDGVFDFSRVELDPPTEVSEEDMHRGKESRHEAFDCPEVKLDPTKAVLKEDIHRIKESKHEAFDCSEVEFDPTKVLEEYIHRGKESRHAAFDCSKEEINPNKASQEDMHRCKESRHETFDFPEVNFNPTEASEEDMHRRKESRDEAFDFSKVKLNLNKELEEDTTRGKESRHEAFDCSKLVKINPNKTLEEDTQRDEESTHEVFDCSEVKVDPTSATEVKANPTEAFDCLEAKLDSMEALLEEPRNVEGKKERVVGKTEANDLVLRCELGGLPNNSGELIQHTQGDNAHESSIGTNSTLREDEMKVFLASRSTLMSILGRLDRTRLLGVTRDINFSQGRNQRLKIVDMDTTDAGGEDPYDPKKDELVLMLSVEVDGQEVVGADILLASIIANCENGTSSWKLELRNPL